jgi:DNA polymerase V
VTTQPVQQLALVDCNNFYVSCERLFRPDLAGRPVVVLSNNDGCVVSRSNEAKAIGIAMGQPWFQAKALAEEHNILALSSNYALYADLSNRVMNLLAEFSPRHEVYSIDECFVDLTGMSELRTLSYAMREKIMRWTGIPVCVGIGPTKTLAKLANFIAKKHPRSQGVFNYNALTEVQKAKLLSGIPVDEVWGVGRKLAPRLAEYGIHTVQALKEAHAPTLRAEFGVVVEKIQRELQEVACVGMEETTPARQQIIASRSFGNPVQDVASLKAAIALFVENACIKLRSQQSHASMLQVFLRTNRFRPELPQYHPTMAVSLVTPTDSSLVINRWAGYLVDQIWRPEYAYKKAGVMLSEITPNTQTQNDLFADAEPAEESKLMGVLDRVNQRFGRGVLRISSQDAGEAWGMRQERKSPAYTTSWGELPSAVT